jgi:hypothetical protein
MISECKTTRVLGLIRPEAGKPQPDGIVFVADEWPRYRTAQDGSRSALLQILLTTTLLKLNVVLS